MKAEEVDAEAVRTLARVAGISVPDEDIEPLVAALRNHLRGMDVLDELDLEEYDPIVVFDPRWT